MEKQKKKFYKRWWFWVIILLLLIIGIGAGGSGGSGDEEAANTEETAPEEETLSFVLMDNEVGDYGVEVVLNEGTEFEEHKIAYHIPAGIYSVTNQNDKGAGQVTVYSGGPEYDGEWQYFVADENCADPIVVMPGETKELEIKEGQFIVLSDETSNFQFTIQ